jgi:hypothetical protein
MSAECLVFELSFTDLITGIVYTMEKRILETLGGGKLYVIRLKLEQGDVLWSCLVNEKQLTTLIALLSKERLEE